MNAWWSAVQLLVVINMMSGFSGTSGRISTMKAWKHICLRSRYTQRKIGRASKNAERSPAEKAVWQDFVTKVSLNPPSLFRTPVLLAVQTEPHQKLWKQVKIFLFGVGFVPLIGLDIAKQCKCFSIKLWHDSNRFRLCISVSDLVVVNLTLRGLYTRHRNCVNIMHFWDKILPSFMVY